MNYFGIALVILFTGAAVYAAIFQQWNEAVYSFCAAALNYVVYFKPFG